MAQAWKHKPDAYLGLAAPHFPNYFTVTGPQGPLGNGTILPAVCNMLSFCHQVQALTYRLDRNCLRLLHCSNEKDARGENKVN